jgi:hypothetical protein
MIHDDEQLLTKRRGGLMLVVGETGCAKGVQSGQELLRLR